MVNTKLVCLALGRFNKVELLIRGWTNYYSFSDAQTMGVLTGQDRLVFLKLRAWSRHRIGDWYKAQKKYWTTIGKNKWVFATRKGDENPLRLLTHTEFGSSSTEYVKVKGDTSPFNGKLTYWSTRRVSEKMCGDLGTWGLGDLGTWGLGDLWTWGLGDLGNNDLPISLSPYLPISLSPYLPISLSPYLPTSYHSKFRSLFSASPLRLT